jgi:quinone-modifying oxidoreductase subunit QmoB
MTVPSYSEEQGLTRHVLVVGGGVTGMNAALEIAAAGYQASIVEKTGALGGHVAMLYKKVPGRSPYAEPEAEEKITVHLNRTVTKTSGGPGRFSADITPESGSTATDNFGAIVQASGFNLYDANQLPELGYGKSPDVVTNLELEALAKAADGGPIKRPSDGKEVKAVAFVQCAGQRSEKEGHLPYCSGFCCTTSMKQAMYFKEQNPDCDATVLFSDLRTPGAPGEDFYRAAQKKQVTFSKGDVSEVVSDGGGLKVMFKDEILNEETEMECDLVVLATGMVANNGPDPYAQMAIDETEDEAEKAKLQAAQFPFPC